MDNVKTMIQKYQYKKAAIFIDKAIEKEGLQKLITEQLDACGVSYSFFDEIPVEPSYQEVQRVSDELKAEKWDFIIACGGGSVLDTAKLAGILMTDEYGVKDLLDNPSLARKTLPLVAIPTTAGTGAEATPNAIVAVLEKELKVGIVSEELIPDYVVLAAEFVEKIPRSIFAATGIDALCHAVECYTGNKANAFSDLFALEACDLIFNNLERACDDAAAMEEKRKMQMAAFYAGIAITASGTTGVHALSYPLGGKYHIAHGVSNAMLLCPVMRWNEPAVRERLAEIYERCHHGAGNHAEGALEAKKVKTVEEKSQAVIRWMERIVNHLDIPQSLGAFGVCKEDVDGLVASAMEVKRLLANNVREITEEDARRIYLQIL